MTVPRKNLTAERASAVGSRGPTVAAGLARGVIDFAAACGADRHEISRLANVDVGASVDQDRRLPLDDYLTLTRVATAVTGDPAFALNFGIHVDIAELSAVGLLFQASETIAEVLRELNRYTPLLVQIECTGAERFEQHARGDEIWIVDTRTAPNSAPEITEATFARFMRTTRQFGMGSFIAEVHVTHQEPAHSADYTRVFGTPTTFSAYWNAIRVDKTWLSQRVRLQPAYLVEILRAHTDSLLTDLENAHSMSEQVRRLLMPRLHTGGMGMQLMAQNLGLSSDSLYRRLRAEGVTFDEVLDDLRKELALRYIEEKAASLSEIAYLVGFSEPSAFSRAFKRWTGTSPRSYRARPRLT